MIKKILFTFAVLFVLAFDVCFAENVRTSELSDSIDYNSIIFEEEVHTTSFKYVQDTTIYISDMIYTFPENLSKIKKGNSEQILLMNSDDYLSYVQEASFYYISKEEIPYPCIIIKTDLERAQVLGRFYYNEADAFLPMISVPESQDSIKMSQIIDLMSLYLNELEDKCGTPARNPMFDICSDKYTYEKFKEYIPIKCIGYNPYKGTAIIRYDGGTCLPGFDVMAIELYINSVDPQYSGSLLENETLMNELHKEFIELYKKLIE